MPREPHTLPSAHSLAFWVFLLLCITASWGDDLVSFSGNDKFSDAELEAQLGLPEQFPQLPPARQDFLMRLAKGNLEVLYYSSGYFNCRAELSAPDETEGQKQARYHIRIDEGALFHFRKVTLVAPDWSLPTILEPQSLRTSNEQTYDPEDIAEDLLQLRQAYRRRGYLHVRVDHVEVIDTTAARIDLEFNIDPGNLVRMGNLSIHTRKSGEQSSKAQKGISDTNWVGGLWRIPGQSVVNGRYYGDFRTKLFDTQLFAQVRLEDTLRNDGSGLSDLTLTLIERVPGERRLGAFFEQGYYGWGVSAEDRHRNLFGRFNEGSAGVMISQNRQEVVLGYANPLLFGTAVTFIPTAIRLDNRILVSREELPLPQNPDSLEKRNEIANRGDITFGLNRFLRLRSSGDLRFVSKPEEDLLKLKFSISLDMNLTDNLFEPTRGLRIKPTVGNGGLIRGYLNAPNLRQRYWYGNLHSSFYLPLWGPLLSAFAADLGHFFSPAVEEDARAFYQGGSRTVRGYRFRSIYPSQTVVPTAPGEDTLFNTGLQPSFLRLSQEFRLNLPGPLRSFQLVQFGDWARVRDASDAFTTGQGSALGLGLRFRWQVLTLRLDYTMLKDVPPWEITPFQSGLISFDLSQAI